MKSRKPTDNRAPMAKRFGVAWLVLAITLGLHVTDEALTGFLSVWNPTVLAIRDRVPWSPLPTFTFEVWITGLITLFIVLLLLTPLAFSGVRWLAFVAIAFSALMFANGLLHLGASLAQHRLMPGFWSSPLLVASSAGALLHACGLVRRTGRPHPGATGIPDDTRRVREN